MDSRFVDDVLARLGERRRVTLNLPHWLVVPEVLRTTDLVAVMPERLASVLASPRDGFARRERNSADSEFVARLVRAVGRRDGQGRPGDRGHASHSLDGLHGGDDGVGGVRLHEAAGGAADQFAADLRLAHTRATEQLTDLELRAKVRGDFETAGLVDRLQALFGRLRAAEADGAAGTPGGAASA